MITQKSTNPILSIQNLSVAYNDRLVLDSISLNCEKGKFIGIMGPNGAGKSTLIKSCFNLLPRRSGKISVNGKPNDKQFKNMAYVPQTAQFDWTFPISVFEVVLMGSYASLGLFKRPQKNHQERTMHCLEILEIADLAERTIGTLSGGQKQRMILARALCQESELLFLDEPFVGIDVKSEEIIIKTFRAMVQNGTSILCVHHDLKSATSYFDQVILLNKKLIAYGDTSKCLSKKNLAAAYNYPDFSV